MLPLFGGAVILALVIIFGISAATSLLIERQRLFALADSAGLAGAESFDPAKLSLTSSG
ncbi:MAG: pilus assembly protein TadG-related protein, partial [Pontimonas sp.]